MEQVAELNKKTVEIMEVVFPTIGYFIPLLEEKRAQITGTPKRTFKYGENERHKLDIYYPESAPTGGKTPVLFFIYGGGFFSGARTQPAPADLGYANLATWFTNKGFITIIPDYRLMPEVKFPGPMEDVRDAVKWVLDNPEKLRYAGVEDPDTEGVYLIGHSAGGVNVATLVLLDGLVEQDVKEKIKGLLLISPVYHFDPVNAQTAGPDTIEGFWGGVEEGILKKSPYALLKNASSETVENLKKKRVLLVESERDPESFLTVGKQFQELLEEKTGKKYERLVAQGHNHISISWALSTGQGEEWAVKVSEWLKGA